MTAVDSLLTILIVLGIFIIVYAKVKKQSMRETVMELIEMIKPIKK